MFSGANSKFSQKMRAKNEYDLVAISPGSTSIDNPNVAGA